LYVMEDRRFIDRLISRAKAANCSALVLTLDLQIQGQRHKDLKNGLTAPPKLTVNNILNILGSRGRRNTLTEGVAMRAGRRRSDRALRAVVPRSPGRPGVAQRENRRRFWAAIAVGRSSEAAAIEVGVSPAVGARWFREAGGMSPRIFAPSAKPPSERYLSVAEREELALLRARGCGVGETARRPGRAASTLSR